MKKLIILSAIIISGLTYTAAQAQDRHYANHQPAHHVEPYHIGVVYRDENRTWNGERNYNNPIVDHESTRRDALHGNYRFVHDEHARGDHYRR
jgi:hypothetical protein